MPKVGNINFAYTKEGKKSAKKLARNLGVKVEDTVSYQPKQPKSANAILKRQSIWGR